MEITLTPDIEKALVEQARRQGATPEMLALDVLRERFVSSGAPEMGMNEEATLADFLAGHIGEPEVHFVRDSEVLVPDIAGWRRERMPKMPSDHRFEVIPDWVCEVLSPSTSKKDRFEKMPLYARHGVSYLWLVDPLARTLEVFEWVQGHWTVVGQFKDNAEVSAAPFQELTIALSDLWAEL